MGTFARNGNQEDALGSVLKGNNLVPDLNDLLYIGALSRKKLAYLGPLATPKNSSPHLRSAIAS